MLVFRSIEFLEKFIDNLIDYCVELRSMISDLAYPRSSSSPSPPESLNRSATVASIFSTNMMDSNSTAVLECYKKKLNIIDIENDQYSDINYDLDHLFKSQRSVLTQDQDSGVSSLCESVSPVTIKSSLASSTSSSLGLRTMFSPVQGTL